MINNDSIITAYDEHLTLVEWLQKVEVLLKNGGLKEFTLNDKGNATFSLTLVFNDGSKIESNAMTLASVNEALTALNSDVEKLNSDVEKLKKYKGYDNITYDKANCVRISNDFSTMFDTDEMTLKPSEEITLSSTDAAKAFEIILRAVNYGFVVEPLSNSFMITPLIQVTFGEDNLDAYFGIPSDRGIVGYEIRIYIGDNGIKYSCKRTEI